MPRRPWLPITRRTPSPSSRIFSSSRCLASDLSPTTTAYWTGTFGVSAWSVRYSAQRSTGSALCGSRMTLPSWVTIGGRRDDVEDDDPGAEGLGERPGDPEGFLRRFVEIGRVNERLEHGHAALLLG